MRIYYLLPILFILAGCATTQTDNSWDYYGWDTNLPSLKPITNIVDDPIWPVY